MNDEVMNVLSFCKYDGCKMMKGVLLWGIEGNYYVHFMVMLWCNVLTWFWVCEDWTFSSYKPISYENVVWGVKLLPPMICINVNKDLVT